jgi:carbamoyl-phosphate synthase small subunit
VFSQASDNAEEIDFTQWAYKVSTSEVRDLGWLPSQVSSDFPGGKLVNWSEVSSSYPQAKTIALIDTGAKENIMRELAKRGHRVVVFPAESSTEQILSYDPDGLVISNGPGDPQDYPQVYETVRELIEYSCKPDNYLPIFGICLGNQLLTLAIGGTTFKMKFGNRGANQPVQNELTGRAFLTTQNHSHAVERESLPSDWQVLFSNLNDGTVEGMQHRREDIFSVQFHPEACGGPRDTNFLFDRFLEKVERGSV